MSDDYTQDEWDEYLESLTDEQLRSVITQSRDQLESRRMDGFNKIPIDKIDALMPEMRRMWHGKNVTISLTLDVPVTINYEDGDPYCSNPRIDTHNDVVEKLESDPVVKQHIKAAKKEWKAFWGKLERLAKKYDVKVDLIWDELENRM
jgi:hypothetical protein